MLQNSGTCFQIYERLLPFLLKHFSAVWMTGKIKKYVFKIY